MPGKAAVIEMTEVTYAKLQRLASSPTCSQGVVCRIMAVLLGFRGLNNQEISAQINFGRQAVGKWRRRWQQSFGALVKFQLSQPIAALDRELLAVFSDAPRSGTKPTFSPEQFVEIVSIATEKPEASGRPVSTWTGRELADEAVKRKLVKSISTSQVNRFLKTASLQPHRSDYWCFTTEKDAELFSKQVRSVCDAYLLAPYRYHRHGIHTVSVDEMTSLQANQRRAETKLPQPGVAGKTECQYTRHGTVCLTGNWHVTLGKMLASTINITRNNRDFAMHIRHTVQTDPEAGWVFILDNLNTHCGESLVRTVAAMLGIDQTSLGIPKKKGVLKSMATRKAFLSDESHRIRFVYLPKHSSWLNQIERIFGIISRRVMRLGSFTSKSDLTKKLLAFIQYFNETFAKPMNWTYNGRPVHDKATEKPKTWRQNWKTRKNRNKIALVTQQL